MRKGLLLLVVILIACPMNAEWTSMTMSDTTHLTGLYAMDGESVWVVGNTGRILRFDGTDWNIVTSNTDKNLNDIAMISETEGWAVGEEGTILHCEAGVWSAMAGLDEQLNFESLYAFDIDDVYFIGYGFLPGGSVMHYDGVDMTEVFHTGKNLMAIAADSPDNIWIVGDDNFRLYFDGTDWTEDASTLPESTKLFSVAIDEDGEPIISGMRLPGWDLAKIYKKVGTQWKTEFSDYAPWLLDIDLHETVGFCMGKQGRTIERSIFGWQRLAIPTSNQINELDLLDMSRGWAVCDGGIVLKYENPAIDMQLENAEVSGGDQFSCAFELLNPGPEIDLSVFVLLEAYGSFFYWPSWGADVDFQMMTLDADSYETTVLFEFAWPSAGSGMATFWGALVDGADLIAYDTELFTWSN